MFYYLTNVIADQVDWIDEGSTRTSCLSNFVVSSIAS
jgi:hypothetical protein